LEIKVLTTSQIPVRFLFFGLLAAPLLAQTQIGGGTCSSSSLNGTYAVSITGRQVSASGAFTSMLQANGTATFDGLSTVAIALTEDTNQAVATPLTWSGTYSVEANCVAIANITSGGSATLNVLIYNQGKDFTLSGSDATYSYGGDGLIQPSSATCSTATLNGVYTFDATGYALTSTSVSGVTNGAGVIAIRRARHPHVESDLSDQRGHQQRRYSHWIVHRLIQLLGFGDSHRFEFTLFCDEF
jgi:hypothetical protein